MPVVRKCLGRGCGGPCLLALVLVVLFSGATQAQPGAQHIGSTLGQFLLGPDNRDARGVAYGETRKDGARLFVLDRKKTIYAYRLPADDVADGDLQLVDTYPLEQLAGLDRVADPRGLAVEMNDDAPVFYFLDWVATGNRQSLLVEYDTASGEVAVVDLTRHLFRIGDREPADLTLCSSPAGATGSAGSASAERRVIVCFDSAGYPDPSLRVQRGMVEIQWQNEVGYDPLCVRHLPDAGTQSSQAVTWMSLDGFEYLWATAGDSSIYCAEGATGRGLFYFDRPAPGTGMAYGAGSLWVAGSQAGPDRIYRVNVTRNPDAHREGPHVLRRMVMRIRTTPSEQVADAGAVYHTYSRPARYELLHRQGIWPETERLVDESQVPHATLETITMDPAGDVSSRQVLRRVTYASAPSREYASRYEIDMWTSPYRKYVYPHRVNTDETALAGANYLADDPDLYNLSDRDTYTKFIERVREYIQSKYGAPADMQNPYWAARNVVEYIQDNYYYPNREKRRPATVDYDRKHYDANPANLKIAVVQSPLRPVADHCLFRDQRDGGRCHAVSEDPRALAGHRHPGCHHGLGPERQRVAGRRRTCRLHQRASLHAGLVGQPLRVDLF